MQVKIPFHVSFLGGPSHIHIVMWVVTFSWTSQQLKNNILCSTNMQVETYGSTKLTLKYANGNNSEPLPDTSHPPNPLFHLHPV
jgi:hypothetical protein